ncbi:MAG: M24 family metallopeptidase [Lachnotalea sp.]
MNKERLNKVLVQLKENETEQMIITDPATIFYLTGKWVDPGERLLALYINIEGTNRLFLNELFTVPVDLGVEKVWFSDIEDGVSLIAKVTDSTKTLGIDKNMAARFLLRLMELNSGSTYINASKYVDDVRACKDDEEQKFMKTVSKINDIAMKEFKGLIKSGITEMEMASQMEEIYRNLGADGFSFEPLVGFGKNAAIGHHSAGNAVLKEGDCVLVDVGCKKDNYCADMTRTFFYKSVTEEQKKVYELVKKANETAENMIKPGVRFCDIDQAARTIISEAGYGAKFTHRLGHSIGIEVHEYGDVSSANENMVKEGMIFSIEPGIYLEDNFGVRIEDLVLVTKDGMQRLNNYTKELTIIE